MSKQLSKIETTCPIYNKIEKEINYIESLLDEETYSVIKNTLITILDYADEIRNIAGDLRDTASDIADTKDKEIINLQNELEDKDKEIERLNDIIYDLRYEINVTK